MARRMQEYAVHADYPHIHECADADPDENLIHNIHVEIFAKRLHFLDQKWVSLSLLFTLSWFYPSSGIQVQNHNNLVKNIARIAKLPELKSELWKMSELSRMSVL